LPKSTAPTRLRTGLCRRSQVPAYVPCPPKCGGKGTARHFFRDDMKLSVSVNGERSQGRLPAPFLRAERNAERHSETRLDRNRCRIAVVDGVVARSLSGGRVLVAVEWIEPFLIWVATQGLVGLHRAARNALGQQARPCGNSDSRECCRLCGCHFPLAAHFRGDKDFQLTSRSATGTDARGFGRGHGTPRPLHAPIRLRSRQARAQKQSAPTS
jgi:hypothetical protein